jgi:hypothetical protein
MTEQTKLKKEGVVAPGEHSIALIGRVAARLHMVSGGYATIDEARQASLAGGQGLRDYWVKIARAAIGPQTGITFREVPQLALTHGQKRRVHKIQSDVLRPQNMSLFTYGLNTKPRQPWVVTNHPLGTRFFETWRQAMNYAMHPGMTMNYAEHHA